MVGRRGVLLSVAVLGVEAVFGGPLGRREDVSLNTPAALPPRPLPTPLTRSTTATVVEIVASVNIGTDDAGIQQSTTPATLTVPTRPGGAPPAIPSPKPAQTAEEGAIDLGTGSTGGNSPMVVVEEEVIDLGAPSTTTTRTPPTIPTRPGGVPPAITTSQPTATVEEVFDFGGDPTTTSTTAPPTVPTRTSGPPVVPKPPVVVEEEVIDFGSPTTTATTTPPTVPTRPGGGPPVVAPPVKVVSLESNFDFGGGASPNTGVGNDPQTGTEYTYPGVWVSGSLVTAVNSLTRTAMPSVKSVLPNTSTRKPPRPPGVNAPGVDNDLGDPTPDATAASTTPQAIPTPPRGPPPKIISNEVTAKTTQDVDLTLPVPESEPTRNPYANSTITSGPLVTTTEVPRSVCLPSEIELLHTTYSIVYTSTLTWIGNPEDYTPLYPPISTPTAPDCVIAPDPARLTYATATVCSSTGTGTKFVTCYETTKSFVFSGNLPTTTAALMAPGNAGPPEPSNMVTVITTDKNPAVVFPTKAAPNYGVTSAPRTQDPHNAVTTPAPNNNPPSYNQGGDPSKAPMREPPTTAPVTIAVQPTAVVINDHTITDDPSGKTSVVIISGVTFTIGPSEVVGGGSTIDRAALTGGLASTPTTSRIGNINVVISSSVAVVDGSSFTLGPTSTTAIVGGQTVVIGPSAVVVGGETVSAPTLPKPTEVVVAGGDLITAIGQSVVVIQSTTITYGLTGSSTTVIDNDTITFGPGGVTVHGTTLGGTAAKPGATDFAVAGGATITKIGASVVVIGGSTYTVGPGMGTTTMVVGGETITIGPSGVKVSTLTLPWPFGPTTVITPKATPTQPAATAAGAEDEDAAVGVRPESALVMVVGLVVGLFLL